MSKNVAIISALTLCVLGGYLWYTQESSTNQSPTEKQAVTVSETEANDEQSSSSKETGGILAKDHYEKAVKKKPKDLRAKSQFAEIQFIKGDFETSFQQLITILKASKQPSAWENYSQDMGYALALSLYEQNYKKEEIINMLESNLQLNPNAPRILAEIYRKQQKSSQAEELLEDGILRFPKDASLYRDLAMINFEKKNFKETNELAAQWNQNSTDQEEKDLSFDLRYQAFLGSEIEFDENRRHEIDELFRNWKENLPTSELLIQRQKHYQAYRSQH